MASKLNKRVQIKRPVLTPDSNGVLSRTYETLLTIWAEIKPINTYSSTTEANRTSYVRGEQILEATTHKARVRRSAINALGRAFSSGFSVGFDSIADLQPLKSELFIFLQKGSTIRGRLFRIIKIENVKGRDELVSLRLMEIEEQGTGAPN